MALLPSSVGYASFAVYSPRGKSDVAILSREVTYAIKQDKFMRQVGGPVIPFLAERIKARLDEYPFLRKYLGPDVVLVPAPRSSPLAPGALWPALKICEALVAQGLGQRVEPCLERVHSVTKSATAAPGGRPGPVEHYESALVKAQGSLEVPRAVTLVDDVVTRGATFIGLIPHLQAAFPQALVCGFAVVRTVSYGEIEELRVPIEGTITFDGRTLKREP